MDKIKAGGSRKMQRVLAARPESEAYYFAIAELGSFTKVQQLCIPEGGWAECASNWTCMF